MTLMENFAGNFQDSTWAPPIIVDGTLVATPRTPSSPLRFRRRQSRWRAPPRRDYPLQKKRHSLEYLRTIAHLRPSTNTFQAVFRVRSLTAYAIHQFFQERGFVYVHTPLITGSDCEGAGRDVPGDHPGPEQRAQDRGRHGGLHAGLLRQAHQPDRQRPAQRRDLRHGLPQYLHLRPHLPGGELQHHPPCRRVLDDRAGDGLRRSGGQHGAGGGHDQVYHLAMCWSTRRRK